MVIVFQVIADIEKTYKGHFEKAFNLSKLLLLFHDSIKKFVSTSWNEINDTVFSQKKVILKYYHITPPRYLFPWHILVKHIELWYRLTGNVINVRFNIL